MTRLPDDITNRHIFRRIFTHGELELAVINRLETWFPTYLKEIEIQLGRQAGLLRPPLHYTRRNTMDSLPGEQDPRVVVVCGPLIGTPRRDGQRQYSATWRLGVGVAASDPDEEEVNFKIGIYSAGVVAIMLAKPGWGNVASYVTWIESGPQDLSLPTQTLQYRAWINKFAMQVNNVVTATPGPTTPDPVEAGTSFGQVEKVFVDLEVEEIA